MNAAGAAITGKGSANLAGTNVAAADTATFFIYKVNLIITKVPTLGIPPKLRLPKLCKNQSFSKKRVSKICLFIEPTEGMKKTRTFTYYLCLFSILQLKNIVLKIIHISAII
jgi:hypothetical protein